MKHEDIVEALRQSHGNLSLSGRMLGCTREGVRKRVKKSATLMAILEDERETVIDTAESALQRAVLNGEGWAISMTLKTIGKNRGYVERIENEMSGPGGKEIKLVIEDMSDIRQD